jgi:hypothetical protein
MNTHCAPAPTSIVCLLQSSCPAGPPCICLLWGWLRGHPLLVARQEAHVLVHTGAQAQDVEDDITGRLQIAPRIQCQSKLQELLHTLQEDLQG